MNQRQQNTIVQEGSPLAAAMGALRAGRMILVVDEDSGAGGSYLCMSARRTTSDDVNFMASHGRGLVSIALTEAQMRRLEIPMMAPDSPLARRLAFGASIEAARGVTTGISAADRAVTIQVAANPTAVPADIVMPGHVFPIQVRRGGVLLTPGIPEAALDLCRMANEEPAATLCAVLDDDGEVAREPLVREMSDRLGLPLVTVGELVAHRLRSEIVVERVAERNIESAYGGQFRAVVYRNDFDRDEHIALVAGDLGGDEPVMVRVHSQCLTGDVFGSTRCDCGEQLVRAIDLISREGRGVVVYMNQEGRGIGLANKIRAYALQDQGRDTVEANLELGFKDDLRDYGITAQIIKDLGGPKVRLLTNNPQKIAGLERYGIDVVERRSLQIPSHSENIAYLRTKKSKLGHLLDEAQLEPVEE
ncbi:MAG: 3,4-dihydroxy 2-butanone 4-phosphate synthase/GTP cyclohydrolase II [Candidatus Binatia bacterium]